MARYGITVNCVCPGPTNTALLAQMGDDPTTGLRAALAKSIPLRREGEPDDIAGVVAFLATDDAVVHDRSDGVGQRRPHDELSAAVTRSAATRSSAR